MDKSIKEITNQYLKDRTLQKFADELGINASRQMVYHWKEGKQEPSMMTLLSVLAEPSAEAWAKSWAGECFGVLQRAAAQQKRVVVVHGSDGETIVDPELRKK